MLRRLWLYIVPVIVYAWMARRWAFHLEIDGETYAQPDDDILIKL